MLTSPGCAMPCPDARMMWDARLLLLLATKLLLLPTTLGGQQVLLAAGLQDNLAR